MLNHLPHMFDNFAHFIVDHGTSCAPLGITNLLASLVHLKFAQNLLFHGFVAFAYGCHAFKTHVMHVY
jgi:hypothetical protein